MDDLEAAAQPGAEAEEATAEVEAEATADVDAQPSEPDADAPEDEAEAEDEELVEVSFGGDTFSIRKGAVPDELVERLDGAWSKHTKNQQEVAERLKAVEARESAASKLSGMSEELLKDFSTGQQLQAEIARYEQALASGLWQSNSDQARQVSDMLTQRRSELQQTIAKVDQTERTIAEAQKADMARRVEEGMAAAEKLHPGFSKVVPEVIDYAVKTYGVDRAQAEREWALSPAGADMARKAMLFDRMQSKASEKPKPKPAQPIQQVRGKGGKFAKDVSAMSTAEMAKHLGLPG